MGHGYNRYIDYAISAPGTRHQALSHLHNIPGTLAASLPKMQAMLRHARTVTMPHNGQPT